MLWMTPLLFFLVPSIAGKLQDVTIHILHYIPAYESYISATRHNELAKVVWTYGWVTSPFVILWLWLCCRDLDLKNEGIGAGVATIIMLVFAIWLCGFVSLEAYNPDVEEFGRWQRLYRESKFGVVLIVGLIWCYVAISVFGFMRWLSWVMLEKKY